MQQHRTRVGFLLAIGASTAAHATVLSTPLVSRQAIPESIQCSVVNVTTKPVTVNSVKLISDKGVEHPTSSESACTFPNDIFPNLGCIQDASSVNPLSGNFVRCVVDYKGSRNALRVLLRIQGAFVENAEAH
jgi:hypothetical protein